SQHAERAGIAAPLVDLCLGRGGDVVDGLSQSAHLVDFHAGEGVPVLEGDVSPAALTALRRFLLVLSVLARLPLHGVFLVYSEGAPRGVRPRKRPDVPLPLHVSAEGRAAVAASCGPFPRDQERWSEASSPP